MSDARSLMLIDGHALMHRAFHAIPELSTSTGEPTNAVFGFSNIVLKEINELRPTHVIMALDMAAPTFRHEAFAGYKATRPRTPRELVSQFARVREVAGAMHIAMYEQEGFEADDVLGTLARQAEDSSVSTTIVTGDLDALQLVSTYVQVLTPGRGVTDTTLYDEDAVRRRYGIEPAQLPDWKALVGDKSDNIPGVQGIGNKSATELIARFGSIEGLYEHLEDLTPRQRTLLEPGREQAIQSKHLATIVRDVPVRLDLEHCAWNDVDRTELLSVFRELEFRSLVERVQAMMPRPGTGGGAPVTSRPGDGSAQQLSMFGEAMPAPGSMVEVRSGFAAPDTETRVVRTPQDLEHLVRELQASPLISIDTETTSTDPLTAKLVGLSFSTCKGHGWYVPVGHVAGEQLTLDTVMAALRPILQSEECGKIGHNLKYDFTVLERSGITVQNLAFDTMLAAYLVNRSSSSRGLSLSALALERLSIEMTPIEALIGKGRTQTTMDAVDLEAVAIYAGADADVTLRLHDQLAHELISQGQEELFRTVEMPLIPVLARMEEVGVRLDTDVLRQMSSEMSEIIGRLEGEIYEFAGRRLNINSTQQLGQLLFVELDLPSGRRTKTGYSTDNEVLERLRGRHEIIDAILEYRQLIKLRNTYVDALPGLIDHSGKVHTDFNQAVAATGRLSSSNPNLQNIPIRGDLGRRIRRAFVPDAPGNVLLAADYSQIELRVLASMSHDERLMSAFLGGEDVHRATAAAVFNVEPEHVTSDQRRIAKVVNFGIIYGIGEQRLGQETGISRAEAAEFIASYNRTYAGVKAFMDNLRKQAALSGYVGTLLGRRRYIPDINSSNPGIRAAAERAAINMPIQGTAADIIKIAMIRLDSVLADRFPDAHMVLQVHDELVFDVPQGVLEEVAQAVQHEMEHALPLDVPLEIEMKAGRDWYDMTPLARVAALS